MVCVFKRQDWTEDKMILEKGILVEEGIAICSGLNTLKKMRGAHEIEVAISNDEGKTISNFS